MKSQAPIASKLSWAFKIYGTVCCGSATYILKCHVDFNEDEFIDCEDLNMIMDNLTGGTMAQETKNLLIDHVTIMVNRKYKELLTFCATGSERSRR